MSKYVYRISRNGIYRSMELTRENAIMACVKMTATTEDMFEIEKINVNFDFCQKWYWDPVSGLVSYEELMDAEDNEEILKEDFEEIPEEDFEEFY